MGVAEVREYSADSGGHLVISGDSVIELNKVELPRISRKSPSRLRGPDWDGPDDADEVSEPSLTDFVEPDAPPG